jgi:S1-C subfamily serine protease
VEIQENHEQVTQNRITSGDRTKQNSESNMANDNLQCSVKKPSHEAVTQPNADVLALYKEYQSGSKVEVAVNSTNWYGHIIPVLASNSGFFVKTTDPQGCVVATVDSAVFDRPSVHLQDGSEYPAHVVFTDVQNHLALLKVSGVKNPSQTCAGANLSDKVTPPDSPVVAIENSNLFNENQVPSAGSVIRTASRRQVPGLLQPGTNYDNDIIALHLPSGFGGGGPVFDSKGDVIGVAESSNYMDVDSFTDGGVVVSVNGRILVTAENGMANWHVGECIRKEPLPETISNDVQLGRDLSTIPAKSMNNYTSAIPAKYLKADIQAMEEGKSK